MAASKKAIEPICDVNILRTERVLLVENIVYENVMPCIKSFLIPRQVDAINAEKSEFDRIGKILDYIERLTQCSQYATFNALMKAVGGTQPGLFKRLVGRVPTETETTFCVKEIVRDVKDNIIETGHCTDSELDETISFEYEHVDLSIVGRQSGSEQEHQIPHEYGDHLTKLEATGSNISASDILSSQSKPNEKVLVFGRPGVGKSTTTQWLARQWALGKWATGVALLFLVQMRFLTNVEVPITTPQLLAFYSLYQLEDMADSVVLSSWLKNPASRILVFIDGLDEIPGFASRIINTHKICNLTHKAHPIDLVINILKGNLLPQSIVISASRPFIGLNNLPVDSKAEVLGLTSRKVRQYVEYRYPRKAKHILSILERNYILLSVCGITFYCMVISRLLSEGVVLIDEEVQTYTRLMAFILVQYTSRKISEFTFCLETNPYLSKLANMAFSGIFLEAQDTGLTKLVFDEKDLIKFNIGTDIFNCIKKTGIVQITRKNIGHSKGIMAEFFHLSGQEMLAVLHFLTNSTCVNDILNTMFAGGHFDMALMFTFGLNFDRKSKCIDELWTAMGSSNPSADTSISSELSLFIDRLWMNSKNKMKVCQLIYEAQWVYKAKEVFNHIAPNGELSIEDITMTAIDILAVDFVCRCTGSLSSITLNKVNADDTFVKVVMSSLFKHNLQTLQEVDLTQNNIGDYGAKTIADTLKVNTCLRTLNVSYNRIGVAGAVAIADVVKSTNSLKDVDIHSNSVGAAGAEAMANMLQTNTSLHTLDIHRNNIGVSGAKVMANMLRHNTSLQTLHIHSNSIGAAGAEAIANMLKHNTSLHTLNISQNKIGARGAVAIAAMLKHNTSLQTLDIHNNNIRAAGAEAIGDMLHNNTSLETLGISINSIGDAGAEAMAAMLRYNTSLQTLNMYMNSIGDAGAEAIAAMLRHNTSLHTLGISHNSIGDAGAEALAGMLEHNTSLQTLDISVNSIESAGAVALAAMLQHNTSLQTLDISGNSIGDAGAVAMAAGLYKNTTLTKLGIANNSIGLDGRKALADVMQYRPTLTIQF